MNKKSIRPHGTLKRQLLEGPIDKIDFALHAVNLVRIMETITNQDGISLKPQNEKDFLF